ncbi:hypothetical protein Pelo_17488 [Pelomyxa schiedti]|nr:hypothetical protein Pelo_17488 [Pelomyxa schiedti]
MVRISLGFVSNSSGTSYVVMLPRGFTVTDEEIRRANNYNYNRFNGDDDDDETDDDEEEEEEEEGHKIIGTVTKDVLKQFAEAAAVPMTQNASATTPIKYILGQSCGSQPGLFLAVTSSLNLKPEP